jgi:3-phosphoshikimate 1-carboxyvinyltransferase
MVRLSTTTSDLSGDILLESSKSISNRILIIKALSRQQFNIKNLSDADDTTLMIKLLQEYKGTSEINCGHAGTTLRFLTSFLSSSSGEWTIGGSDRMHQRPIGPLVKCLNELGADISYIGEKNHPPLKIIGSSLSGGEIEIRGDISSQYISALLMIAPTLKNGLKINITSKVLSKPYIQMTLSLMGQMGIKYLWESNQIAIKSQQYKCKDFVVENDWSGASFWYSFAALSTNANIEIPLLFNNSIQGDSQLQKIYKKLGVSTVFLENKITIKKYKKAENNIKLDLSDYPDIALPIITTCAGLGIGAFLYGLESLKHKESDRLAMIKNELEKFNIYTGINSSSIKLNKGQLLKTPNKVIGTHQDHRIPMSIAPLCLKTESIEFDNKEVVNKSYPLFWKDLTRMGMICI